MWMQILEAAGLPLIGEAFPRDWGETLGELNPHGFFESTLRDGINFLSNPDPRSGVYLHPAETRMHAVKIFADGLERTELAFLDRVLVTVRPWREYAASIAHLLEVENEARGRDGSRRPPRLSPALEWWRAYYGLVRDVAMRRYAVHMQSYPAVLERPDDIVPRVLAWIAEAAGGPLELDIERAVAAVRPPEHPSEPADLSLADELDPRHVVVFDELFDALHEGRPLDPALIERLNATHVELEPLVKEHAQTFAAWVAEHPDRPREPLALE